jgi:hypothetical protein
MAKMNVIVTSQSEEERGIVDNYATSEISMNESYTGSASKGMTLSCTRQNPAECSEGKKQFARQGNQAAKKNRLCFGNDR